MTRIFRLGYILPRLVLLVLLYFALEHGSGWALRYGVIAGGEAALGARVEVDEAVVSVLQTRATLAGVRFANPGRPMENAVEFDRLELDFDSNSLLRKSVVADHGVLHGLRFGTPRETSGAIEKSAEEVASEAPSWLTGAAANAVTQAADAWIDGLEDKFEGQVDDLASVKLVNELRERWPQRFEGLAAEAKSLEAEVKELKAVAKEARANPLRHTDFLAQAPSRAALLRQRLETLQGAIASLPADVGADRERVEIARRRDEAMLRQRLQVDQLDPQALTSTLLGENVAGPLRDLIGWVRWTRAMVPAKPGKQRVTPRDRGADVLFVGVQQRPDLLVRKLELDGTARLAGRPFELVGSITDFTSSPSLHGEPMRLALTTTGSLPMEIRGTIDRTGELARDDFLVDCASFELPEVQLGKDERFALAMAPSTGSLSVSLRIEGQRLAGEVQLVQDRVALTPIVGPKAGKLVQRIGDGMQAALASVQKPATRVTLGGTLDRPEIGVWSTLGPSVAQSLENAAIGIAKEEAQRQVAKAQQKVATEMASLDRLVADSLGTLTAQVEAPRQEIERLASNLIGEQLGRGTSAFEQLGKRLPAAESLFK